jgi:palmitoyltransferase ZDHHC2/15/20
MNMGTLENILQDILVVFISCLYALVEVYMYYIFIGILCLEEGCYAVSTAIVLFVLYHLAISYKILLFIKIRLIEGRSTRERFPSSIYATKYTSKTLGFLNPYAAEQIIAEQSSREAGYCKICTTIKPPRCHHCTKCDKCYLKFDHHSIILDACIGFHNYKFFLQFLFLNFSTCLFYVIIVGVDFIKQKAEKGYIILNYTLSLILSSINLLSTLYALVKHIRLTLKNETTVESRTIDEFIEGNYTYIHIFQEGPIKTFPDSTDRAYLNPYNLGKLKNWESVFGSRYLQYINPHFTSKGDGTSFETHDTSEIFIREKV